MTQAKSFLKDLPPPYTWVVDHGLVGFEPFTALQPWYFLGEGDVFDAHEEWPGAKGKRPLIVFARRQDCDDLACFDLKPDGSSTVVLIEGWSAGAYNFVAEYATFWEWMKTVIDDIAEWSSRADEAIAGE
jgi:hypothetical protein